MCRLTAIYLMAFVFSAFAQAQPACTEAENRRSEEEASTIRAWDALYRSYTLYARCNNVAAAEGYSESVARILVDHWNTLPRLAALGTRNRNFRVFVLDHVDATLDMKDVETIRSKARTVCPNGLRSLCAELSKRANTAMEENASDVRKR